MDCQDMWPRWQRPSPALRSASSQRFGTATTLALGLRFFGLTRRPSSGQRVLPAKRRTFSFRAGRLGR
ncbi:dihydroxy-acid dehydratase, partial [Novosphingobium sp. PY1]